jgi:hypothetical protein
MGVIGASVSAGQGVPDHASDVYPYRFADMISSSKKAGSGLVNVHNGAIAGTVSQYMSVCLGSHVPSDVDLVVVEYAINDPYNAEHDTDMRKAFERLLRKLLNLPKKPAVILLLNYNWNTAQGVYYKGTAEADFLTYATFYSLPALSVRAAVHELLENNVDGFISKGTRAKSPELAGKLWHFDTIHPDGRTGHRAFAELLYHLYNETLISLERQAVGPEDLKRAAAVRKPMVADNYEAHDERCLIGPKFTDAVVSKEGFEYINEAPQSPRPKWGYVATKPGSKLSLKVSTMASSGGKGVKSLPVLVELAHLKSYTKMGIAEVTCSNGCTCNKTEVDGYHPVRNSQLFLHSWEVSQAPECIISVSVTDRSKARGEDKGHKVKLMGIMVSEQAGARHMVQAAAAIDYVGDVVSASKAKGATLFTGLNHV